jgi:hypothetical protein
MRTVLRCYGCARRHVYDQISNSKTLIWNSQFRLPSSAVRIPTKYPCEWLQGITLPIQPGNWRQETATGNLFEYCENLFATLDRRTNISKHKLPDVLSWRKISTGLPHRFPGFLLLFSHLQPFVLVFNPIYHTLSTDPVTIKTMSESSDILKLLIIDTRVKLANLLIGGKSSTEIMFVSFPSQGTTVELTQHRGISEGYEYSDEDIKSLYRHIKEKRPHLAPLLSRWAIAIAELHITGCLKDDVDFAAISAQMPQALEADKAEAALDNSMWGLLEWKWQVSQ